MQIFIDVIGWAGMGALLLGYGLLTMRRYDSASWQYQLLYLLGAVGLMANTAYYEAWPSVALNAFWFVIGGIGLAKGRRARREAKWRG